MAGRYGAGAEGRESEGAVVAVAVWSAPLGGMPRWLHATPPHTEAALEGWVKADPALVRDGLVVVAQQFVFPEQGTARPPVHREQVPLADRRAQKGPIGPGSRRSGAGLRQPPERHVGRGLRFEADSTPRPGARGDSGTGRRPPGLRGRRQPREVSAVVVGVSADEALLRITRHLSERYDVPLSVVELRGFAVPVGRPPHPPRGDRLRRRYLPGSGAGEAGGERGGAVGPSAGVCR